MTFSPQVAEPPSSTGHPVLGSKLSVLKKRWEELQPSSCRTRSVSSSCGPAQPLTSIQSQDLKPQIPAQESPGSARSSKPQNRPDMEAVPPRGSVEGAEVEKPSVSLNSLKMMFETGDTDKASPPRRFLGDCRECDWMETSQVSLLQSEVCLFFGGQTPTELSRWESHGSSHTHTLCQLTGSSFCQASLTNWLTVGGADTLKRVKPVEGLNPAWTQLPLSLMSGQEVQFQTSRSSQMLMCVCVRACCL